MKASVAALNLIKKWEGLRLIAYKCPSGIWTIGYGHTRGVKEGQHITVSEANRFLQIDVASVESYVNSIMKSYGYDFIQSEFDALVSFTFNAGYANLKALTRSGQRTIEEIAEAIPRYCNANGKPLEGLKKRRADEVQLFTAGDQEAYYYDTYMAPSNAIDFCFEKIGVEDEFIGTWRKRLHVAEANGIDNYRGTGAQNLNMIRLARQGKLKRVRY